jgi:hypothetical protein
VGHTRQIHCAPSCHVPDFSRLFPVCVWILPFSIFPVPVVLLPLYPLFVPFVLSALDSHHDSGAVAKIVSNPPCFNTGGSPKVSRLGRARGSFQDSGNRCRCTANHRRDLAEGVILSLGARRPIEYCVSNARSASATVGPIPTMPSSKLDPSSAIQRSPRTNNWGRRTADGLSGWAVQ